MNIKNMTPEDIADFLFYELPADPCTINIVPIDITHINGSVCDATLLFEILITIYMEGITDAERLYKMIQLKQWFPKENKAIDIDIENINCEILLLCEPWFKSFGFVIYVDVYENNDYIYDNSEYCKILLNQNDDKISFVSNNINKRYHFILQKNFEYSNDLSKIKAIFFGKNKIFTIKFLRIN